MRLSWFLVFAVLAAPVLAEDPPPLPRPDPQAASDRTIAEPDMPLPRPRPESRTETPAQPAATGDHEPPKQSEPRLFQTACPAVILGLVTARPLPPLSEKACGERSPLALETVTLRGRPVPVNGGVVTNCQMAMALPRWLDAVDGYIAAHENTHIAAVDVGTSYMCRARVTGTANDTPSEHGFADALDVTGFTLADGRRIRVDTAWPGSDADGRSLIRFAHDAACTVFTTVLGPHANALHHDHLHLDLGCHGKTCTARLCE
jgi:hypothetical protein